MPNQTIVIHIDRKQYKVTVTSMTGIELRQLAQPPIGADRDLFLQVPGSGDDQKIADEEKIELQNGMHFYSVPATINPGTKK